MNGTYWYQSLSQDLTVTSWGEDLKSKGQPHNQDKRNPITQWSKSQLYSLKQNVPGYFINSANLSVRIIELTNMVLSS